MKRNLGRRRSFDTYDFGRGRGAYSGSLTTALSLDLTRRGRGGEEGGEEEAKSGGRDGGTEMECTTGFRRNDARSCAGEI